jgi:predicted nucleotidyltransferase
MCREANVVTVEDVAAEVHRAVGRKPVLLLGSRATGTAHAASDYDLLVLMPVAQIPFRLRRLRAAARDLSRSLGVPVSLNPFPASRLDREQNLFAWKIRREGRVLWAPPEFVLASPGQARLTWRMRFSLASSAAFYLVEAARSDLVPNRAHSVEKCVLHLAQVRLLGKGRYASSLPLALAQLDDVRFDRAAEAAGRVEGFTLARELLQEEFAPLLAATSTRGAFRVNARYVLLSIVRGRRPLRAAFAREPIDVGLVRTLLADLREVDPASGPSPSQDLAFAALVGEWPEAHPLGAQ